MTGLFIFVGYMFWLQCRNAIVLSYPPERLKKELLDKVEERQKLAEAKNDQSCDMKVGPTFPPVHGDFPSLGLTPNAHLKKGIGYYRHGTDCVSDHV